jgi:hypothetical protein
MSGRLTLVAVLLLLSPALVRAETPASDPKAVKIADDVMKSLGGKDRWDKLVGLRWSFEFAVNDTVRGNPRVHAWDKMTGWHKVTGKNRMGQPYSLIEQLDGKGGMAWMNSTAIEGDSLGKLMKRAKSLWTNDTYWMLMPYKLRDPGVTLKYDGEATSGDTTFDKIALSFGQVGETPGDHYWVYVNRKNHRVEKWDFILQGDKDKATWTWEGWEQHDGLWFPTAHRQGNTTLYTRSVETVSAFKPDEFTTP